jgi:hypothetical protein
LIDAVISSAAEANVCTPALASPAAPETVPARALVAAAVSDMACAAFFNSFEFAALGCTSLPILPSNARTSAARRIARCSLAACSPAWRQCGHGQQKRRAQAQIDL